MVTIKDVAKRANVAISTASYALNGIDKVSKETKEKVQKAARELNYQKNGFASDLKRQNTRTIALILSDLAGPFYSELIRGVQKVAKEHGYDLVACNSIGGESSTAVKYLTERRADGCIVLAHNITDQMISAASSKNYPIVLLDRHIEKDSIVSVAVDNKKGAYQATAYLIEQGHHKIAYVSGPFGSYDDQMRFKGYREALETEQIEYRPKWRVTGNFTRESGKMATKILLASEDRPTAILFANDEMAIGGIETCKEQGVVIPDEISIVGFDDILEAKYISPKLTTIRQPKFEMGSLATHLIFQLIDKEKLETLYNLHTELVIRESVNKIQ